MPVGRVKWYDKMKGYGFVESPEGDVFFHFSDIMMDGFKALAEDQRVSYKLIRSDRGLKAKKIQPLDNRATIRHAARYRTLLIMDVQEGIEAEFDTYLSAIPAWFDAMEQDLGLRRIGTWRSGNRAVHLVESDRPYDQSMAAAKELPNWDKFVEWQEGLEKLLVDKPTIMSPIQNQLPGDQEEEVEEVDEIPEGEE